MAGSAGLGRLGAGVLLKMIKLELEGSGKYGMHTFVHGPVYLVIVDANMAKTVLFGLAAGLDRLAFEQDTSTPRTSLINDTFLKLIHQRSERLWMKPSKIE